ncbi:Uncharacterised protein [Delftia tsuruhatensis]|uniref:CzcE family metal-binding protein n=1 Tax=Delftia tsuruhatensis TaxID=180282 RepID=UPI001EF53BB5|nr:CzcE family metal-binding protein [Delftia tsuruhatensis]CAB5720630.1 Uncharacterised protein [Delftia tsuruhatensis]
MKKFFSVGAAAILMTGFAAHADQFPTGKSYYGSPAPAGNYRTIDLSRKEPINITCGETVNFSSQGKVFAWKASSIQHNNVPVSRFAPAGFDAQGRSIFISPSEFEQGG